MRQSKPVVGPGRVLPTRGAAAQARFLVKISWPHRRAFLIASFLAVIGSFAGLAVPLGFRSLLDTVLEGDSGVSAVDSISLALLGLFFVRSMSSATSAYVLGVVGERITMKLRGRLYETLHRQGVGFYVEQPLGHLISRLTNDVTAIQTAVTQTLIPTLTNSIRLVGATVLMLTLNWRLALIVLLVGPLGGYLSRMFGNRLRFLARNVQDLLATVTSAAQESLRAIRTVKLFGRSEHELTRYEAGLRSLFESARQSVRARATYSGLIELVFGVILVALFWYGGREVLAGRLTAGDLAAFLLYGQDVAGSVGALAGVFTGVLTAFGASERVHELVENPPPARDAPGAMAIENLCGEVSFSRISYAYESGEHVLKDLSFTVAPGETIAIVGASGAGKTTLLNLLARFYDPTHGTVLIDDRDVRSITRQSLRRFLAVVPQDVELFSTTVRENIRYGRLDATDAEVEQAASDANVTEFLDRLPEGLDSKVGEGGMKLSGGQRQRLAIARAFLRGAKIILFDEATSSLDGVSERTVHDAIQRLRGKATVLIVAHRLATLQTADRIVVLADGTKVESGTHEELLAERGTYWTLVRSQLGGGEPLVAGIAS